MCRILNNTPAAPEEISGDDGGDDEDSPSFEIDHSMGRYLELG